MHNAKLEKEYDLVGAMKNEPEVKAYNEDGGLLTTLRIVDRSVKPKNGENLICIAVFPTSDLIELGLMDNEDRAVGEFEITKRDSQYCLDLVRELYDIGDHKFDDATMYW